MRTIILPFLFLCFILLLAPDSQAQVRHELKTDLLGLISTQPNLHWEVITPKNIGFQLGARYTFTTITLNGLSSSSVLQIPSYFYREYFTVSGSAKYYFFKKKRGHNLYAGVHTFFKINTALDEDYNRIYRELFDQKSGIDQYKAFFLGIPIGYKWLIKDRFIVDPSIIIGGEVTWLGVDKYLIGSGEFRLELAYRFPAKKIEVGED